MEVPLMAPFCSKQDMGTCSHGLSTFPAPLQQSLLVRLLLGQATS